MRRRTMVVSFALTLAGLAVGGVVAGTLATTLARFSDTANSEDSVVGTSTVELGGDGDGAIEFGYTDLLPGRRQIVDLALSYRGDVPADITLEIEPAGPSAFCVQRDARWQSRPGGAVTVIIDSAVPVNYCELLNGRVLPLAPAVVPESEHHIEVAVMLSQDADPRLRGLAEQDRVTIRASGGFTDHQIGTISITTAGLTTIEPGLPAGDPERAGDGEAGPLGATSPAAVPRSPASGTSPADLPVTLPAECEQAGMRLDDFEDVIVLGPDRYSWNALEQRGQGAGPFLILGSGDGDIVGSESADCIAGGEGRIQAAGAAGDDVLIGGTGTDLLDGGPGDDRLFGGPGVDDLRGGGGMDLFDGGADGAFCDAGPGAAGTTGCQAPAPPGTTPPATSEPPSGSRPATSAPSASAPAIAPETPVPAVPTESSAPAPAPAPGAGAPDPARPVGDGE